MIFLGLPATVANGTNRVGILLQNVGAVWGFHRYGVLDWKSIPWVAGPGILGSIAGTWAALVVGDEAFKKILAILMVLVTLWTLWNPFQGKHVAESQGHDSNLIMMGIGFFAIGAYAGFVQAGVGFFILAVTTMVGHDLVRGNALKVLSVLIFTVVSLIMFAWDEKIDWSLGFTLGIGTVFGGMVGVRLTVLKGHTWIKQVVTIAIIVFALKLWIDS